MANVIFSIDGEHISARRSAFENVLKEMGVSYDTLIGCYKGLTEHSYIMSKVDFDGYVRNSSFVAEQESILSVTYSLRKATLEYNFQTRYDVHVHRPAGHFIEVTESEARRHVGWSHCPRRNKYWICKDRPALDVNATYVMHSALKAIAAGETGAISIANEALGKVDRRHVTDRS